MLRRWLPALIIGILIPRLYLLYSFRSALIESDEAVMGIMGLHMLRGDFSFFMYGQHYLGTLEVLLELPFFFLFGPQPLILKLVPLGLFLLFLVVVFLLARELSSERTAWMVVTLTGISPAFLTTWSLKGRGSMVLLLLGSISLLLTSAMAKRGFHRQGFFAVGLFLGLAWWSHFLAFTYIVPVGVFLLVKNEEQTLRLIGWMIGGFFIGGLPFWIYNLQTSWASLAVGAPEQTSVVADFWNLFVIGLPIILGARGNWSLTPFFPLAGAVVVALLAVAFLAAGKRWFLTIAPANWAGRQLSLIFLVALPLITSCSGFAWFMDEPRYLIPLYSVLFLVILAAFEGKRLQPLVFIFFLGLNLWGSLQITHEEFTIHANVEPTAELVTNLREKGDRYVYAPYWIAYRITFETGEEIIATPPIEDTARYLPYLNEIQAIENPTIIGLAGGFYEEVNRKIDPPESYTVEKVGRFRVYRPKKGGLRGES